VLSRLSQKRVAQSVKSGIRIDVNLIMGKLFPETPHFRFEYPGLKFQANVRLAEDVAAFGLELNFRERTGFFVDPEHTLSKFNSSPTYCAESIRYDHLRSSRSRRSRVLGISVAQALDQWAQLTRRPHLISCPIGDLRPHLSYAQHRLAVDVCRLSALADRGDRAFCDLQSSRQTHLRPKAVVVTLWLFDVHGKLRRRPAAQRVQCHHLPGRGVTGASWRFSSSHHCIASGSVANKTSCNDVSSFARRRF